MISAKVPVDLRNPGQVFACLGLLEASEILFGLSEGRFEYERAETETIFEFYVPTTKDAIKEIVGFLRTCAASAWAPEGVALDASKWGVATYAGNREIFPSPLPETPATLPAKLSTERFEIPIEHWLDGEHCGRDNQKFWAGAGGYPGVALARDAIQALASLPQPDVEAAFNDPFAVSAPMDSSFRLDWRRDYIPLDAGFSPNKQPSISMVGFPFVELLAAIGLQYARPSRVKPRNKLNYRYHVSNVQLPTAMARAVLGSDQNVIPRRTFDMRLGWPGQEGQARCIIDSEEVFS